MVSKQRSQNRRMGKGGVRCRLPCDVPVKSCSWIYFINVGILLLMHSRKLCCGPDLVIFVPENAIVG